MMLMMSLVSCSEHLVANWYDVTCSDEMTMLRMTSLSAQSI